jgi:DNA-binding NtrC family response regulator
MEIYIMAGKGTILAVTEKRSIFGILCAILIKDFDVLCSDGFDIDMDSATLSETKCVIVDLGISRVDPIDFIRDVNLAHPSLRILGLATAGSQQLGEQAKIAGARDVLSVPDEIDRLPSLVRPDKGT